MRLAAAILLLCVATAAIPCAQAIAQDTPPATETPRPPPPSLPEVEPEPKTRAIELADALPEESEALNRLANSRAWTSRALAVMRLERYDCESSAGRLITLAGDQSWRVRAYAIACLARRGIALPKESIERETDPRVIRTILRTRNAYDRATLDARIKACEDSPNVVEAMFALEALAALDASATDKKLAARMDELLTRIVLRMDRTEGGVLSPRLAAITNGDDSGRNFRWREWHHKNHAKPGYRPAWLVPSPLEAGAAGDTRLLARNTVASLEPTRFVAFEKYLASVSDRPMDLAIMIDCTASMGKELADAQSGIDDLVDFLGSVTKGIRIGVVGYRDRTDEWETKAWDFTASLPEARTHLWSLSADGGGDTPESVLAGMKIALGKFTWLPDAREPSPQPIRACVIVGDAPPHPGEGGLCVDLAKRAFSNGVRFYGVVARDSEANLKAEDDDNAPPKAPAPKREQPDKKPTKDGSKGVSKNGGKDGGKVDAPKPPPPMMKKKPSYTWFPEIAEAGGGRAAILKDQDSLVAEIAELTIADKYREEFADFFAAFRLLCR